MVKANTIFFFKTYVKLIQDFSEYEDTIICPNPHELTADYINRNNITTLIAIGAPFIDPYLFHRLQGKIYRVAIRGDDSHHFDVYTRQVAQLFDLNIVLMSQSAAFRLKEMGYNAEYFPFPVPIEIPPVNKSHKKFDVSHIGTIDGKRGRKNYINYLHKNNVNIFVPRENNLFLSLEELYQTYADTKINLSFSGTTLVPETIKKFPDVSRVKCMLGTAHEAISVNSFVLTEYSSDLANYYKDGTHLVSFKDETDLLKKINYYLLNDKEREDIANSAFDFYKKNFSYARIGTKLSKLLSMNYNNPYSIENILWNKTPLMRRYLSSRSVQKMLIRNPKLIKLFI